MAKRNLKKEKALRNEIYAKAHKKDKEDIVPKPSYANWCRIAGHHPACSCTLPTRSEVIEASRSVRR